MLLMSTSIQYEDDCCTNHPCHSLLLLPRLGDNDDGGVTARCTTKPCGRTHGPAGSDDFATCLVVVKTVRPIDDVTFGAADPDHPRNAFLDLELGSV